MVDIEKFFGILQGEGVEFVSGVPDSLLNDFCHYVQDNMASDKHVITANEGNAIALAAGHYLSTGSVPVVYMQNSGIGNSLNPLLSLAGKDIYSIPMVLLIGWRGDPSIVDHIQHSKQGELTKTLLEQSGIACEILDDDSDEAMKIGRWAVSTAKTLSSPVAIIVKKGALATETKVDSYKKNDLSLLSREEAIDHVIGLMPENTRYVATTGRATREIYSVRKKRNMGHNKDFLNLGAMGHCSSIAAGIALGARDNPVVCFDGDAAFLMHMGSIAINGQLGLSNLVHIVLNNGVHESVGGQPSVSKYVKLTSIADNCGFATVGKPVSTKDEITHTLEKLIPCDKSVFVEINIRKGISDDLGPLRIDCLSLKNEFMQSIEEDN